MNPSVSVERQITKLQETVAFQQRAIDHLNEALLQMRTELDRTVHRIEHQQARIKWLSENASGDDIPNERPPHY